MNNEKILNRLYETIHERKKKVNNKKSYVSQLLYNAPDFFLKKIGEEAIELIIASKIGNREEILMETADLWFHCMIALTHYAIHPESVLSELCRREGHSGLETKNFRIERTKNRRLVNHCIFCQIANYKVNADEVYRDEEFIAFWEINPIAPIHILLITIKHVCSDIFYEKNNLLGKMVSLAPMLADKIGCGKNFYLKYFENDVKHLHFNIIG